MPELKEFSNADKQEHGQNAKFSLEALLNKCLEFSYIRDFVSKYRCGYKLYDENQFFCNFLIIFKDNVKWIINTTTSFRSDRSKEQQWDSFNIKEIDKSISKSILVYPDGLSEKEKDFFIAHKLKIINKQIFSAIDDIVSQNELFEMIENYANQNLSVGQKKDKQGNNFESYIAEILSDNENLKKFKTNDLKVVGNNYEFFKKIANKFNLIKDDIFSIKATSDKNVIGTLLTSGSPKTDIIVNVNNHSGLKNYTISCKKTSAKSVSVHQYNADAFADVLDPNNKELRSLLLDFQAVGGVNALGSEKATALASQLSKYLPKLVKWVLGGNGGKIANELQVANYILVYDENDSDIYIHTIDEYVNLLLKPENKSQLGTPFQWTFASGRKGKDIQLKCKIIK